MRTTRSTMPTTFKRRAWRAAAAVLVAAGVIAGVGAASAATVQPGLHASPAAAHASDSQLNLRQGMRGSAVTDLQRQLNSHGHHVKVDGIFGPETTAAVKAFQRDHGLQADGIVGPATRHALHGAPGGQGAQTPASLARQILNTKDISLGNSHPSKVKDPASTPLRNMQDTAAGKAAVTSRYSDVGARRIQLDERMLNGVLKLATSHRFRFNITEIAGGDHSSTSRHYAGIAFDTSIIDGKKVSGSNTSVARFKQACKALGATEVLGPGDPGHATHVHCAWPRH
ncbi:peptidoglycan-binding domain-containing protein [Streptomyces sp. NPDC029216]|uniref:peptidoglycan-binding domain-containing protein n=1 Tax=Streptomyces sp. NPDC029216 TaxID=3154701 RepID=UPI00340F3B8E